LQAIENAGKDVDYYALDLSRAELERTLHAVQGIFKHVRCHGLRGTYDDGLEWLKRPEHFRKPKCILWLGSSIGNLNRSEAAQFIGNFSGVLTPLDSLLIGIDACQNKAKVFEAYNDRKGKTHEFILNGLVHANNLFGKDVFKLDDWSVIGGYNVEKNCHQAFYSPKYDVHVEETMIKSGDRIRVEESYKYSLAESSELWRLTKMRPGARFGNRSDNYRESFLRLHTF